MGGLDAPIVCFVEHAGRLSSSGGGARTVPSLDLEANRPSFPEGAERPFAAKSPSSVPTSYDSAVRSLREKKGKRVSATPHAPPKASPRVELCLLIGPRQIGLAIAKSTRLGPVSVEELEVALPGLGFPLDVSGGVTRFRHRRGELRRLRLCLSWDDLCTYAAARLRDAIVPGTPRVRIEKAGLAATAGSPQASTLLVEISETPVVPKGSFSDPTWARPPNVLAFELTITLTNDDVAIVVGEARGSGLPASATRMAIEAVTRLLGSTFRADGASFSLAKLGTTVASSIFPEAGARAPKAGPLGSSGLVIDVRGIELTLREGRGFVGDERALRACEAARLTLEADRLLVTGDLDGARAAAIDALGRAPRHPEIARRLVELDVLVEGRAEAANAILRDAEHSTALRLGDLPTTLLERMGDKVGALARAVRDADREPCATLRATLRAKAASLSEDPVGALRELDEAATDAPAYPFVHWASLVRALEATRFEDASAQAGFLEALVPSPSEKCRMLVAIGQAYVARGHRDHAHDPFERALRYFPDDPDALAGLGEALVGAGKAVRGAAILARAAKLSKSMDTHASATLALARALEAPIGDLPAAAARAREIPTGHATSPFARLLEGRVRARSGDHEGALLAFARLREEPLTKDHVPLLVEAATLERDVLADSVAAIRSIRRALQLSPVDPTLCAFERALRGAPKPHDPGPMPEPAEHAAEGPVVSSTFFRLDAETDAEGSEDHDEATLDARVERLSEMLRGDPTRDDVVDELVELLTRLGRGLELLALLSARLEDAPPERRDALVVHQRAVLVRLEFAARAEGRNEEASLFAMSREMLGAE